MSRWSQCPRRAGRDQGAQLPDYPLEADAVKAWAKLADKAATARNRAIHSPWIADAETGEVRHPIGRGLKLEGTERRPTSKRISLTSATRSWRRSASSRCPATPSSHPSFGPNRGGRAATVGEHTGSVNRIQFSRDGRLRTSMNRMSGRRCQSS